MLLRVVIKGMHFLHYSKIVTSLQLKHKRSFICSLYCAPTAEQILIKHIYCSVTVFFLSIASWLKMCECSKYRSGIGPLLRKTGIIHCLYILLCDLSWLSLPCGCRCRSGVLLLLLRWICSLVCWKQRFLFFHGAGSCSIFCFISSSCSCRG